MCENYVCRRDTFFLATQEKEVVSKVPRTALFNPFHLKYGIELELQNITAYLNYS